MGGLRVEVPIKPSVVLVVALGVCACSGTSMEEAAAPETPPAAPEAVPAPAPVSAPEAVPAPEPVPEPEPVPAAGRMPDLWKAYVDAGCPEPGKDRLPVYVRALRNVPYAMADYAFKDTSLRAFFAQQEGWYQPTVEVVTLEGPELACVGKLKAWETERRKRGPSIPDYMERGLLEKNNFEFAFSERIGIDLGRPAPSEQRLSDSEDGRVTLSWIHTTGDTGGASMMALVCTPDGQCHVDAAG